MKATEQYFHVVLFVMQFRKWLQLWSLLHIFWMVETPINSMWSLNKKRFHFNVVLFIMLSYKAVQTYEILKQAAITYTQAQFKASTVSS